MAGGGAEGEGDGRRDGVRSVTVADGWRPWRDLLLALATAWRAGVAPARAAVAVPGPALRLPARGQAGVRGEWAGVPGEWALFAGALLIYALTRFWRLGEYPIYFFTDEAFQVLAAEELLQRGWRDAQGGLFPVFFLNGTTWAPYLPVYLHAVSATLLGRSPEVARGTTALLTLLAAGAVGLTVRSGFRARLWWTAPLFLAVTPAWFVHSRTAFETAPATAFFAGFLLLYVLSRRRSVWFLYPALLCAGLSFYSYLAGPTVAVAAGLILLADLPFLLRRWRHLLAALALGAALAVPLLRYTTGQPAALTDRVATYSSYWLTPLPLAEKLRRYAGTYAFGLSPAYWLAADPPDLARHELAGYGHLWRPALPLILLGAAVCLRRWRDPAPRACLLAGLAVPFAAAVTDISITRVLYFVVPAAILAAVGLDTAAGWLPGVQARRVAAGVAFAGLATASLLLLQDALTRGPLWDRDYGLYGQQWGASQLLRGAIPEYLSTRPRAEVLLSSNWANGTDLLLRFFVGRDSPLRERVRMGNVSDYIGERRRLTGDTVFVMTNEDLQVARDSGRFATVEVDRVLPFPDGRPGFHFVRLAYVADLDALLAAEREARRAPVTGEATVAGERVDVRHTRMDIGAPQALFDGDARNLARFEFNPAFVELRFARPRPVAGVVLLLSSGDWEVAVRTATGPDGTPMLDAPPAARATVAGDGREPRVDLVLPPGPDGPAQLSVLRLEIGLPGAPEDARLHLREVQLRPTP